MLNTISLLGALAKDIKFKRLNGVSLADGVISIENDIKEPDYISCKFVGEFADIVKEHLRRGNHVLINGELITSEYRARTGETRLWVEVLVLKMTLLSHPHIKPEKLENIKELYKQSRVKKSEKEV